MPTVLPVAPARPRPGLFEATLLTVGYAVAMFGTILAIFFVAWFALDAGGATHPPADGNPSSLSSFHPTLVKVLAVSFPLGYLAGGLYALIVLRLVVKRGWAREIGLRRLPLAHLGFGVLALPAFVILSDGLAPVLYRLFGMERMLEQSGQLGELFHGFHPAFVLFAVGIAPGVVEELWCRGFLGRGLVGRYGWVAGVVLSSAFFGLLHLWPPPYVILTAVMGACLHFAYACSRSLWVPIFIHAANNGFAGLAAVGAVPTGGMDRALAAWPVLVYGLAIVVL
ncbi:CPBP family intramembrane metalloprotease, partial [bacterium]|nr:CPBP family intramembrane metalloprotease [bacterium]